MSDTDEVDIIGINIDIDTDEEGTRTPTTESQPSLSRTLSREDASDPVAETVVRELALRQFQAFPSSTIDTATEHAQFGKEDSLTAGTMSVWASLHNEEDDHATTDGEPDESDDYATTYEELEESDDTLIGNDEVMDYTPSSMTSDTLISPESSPLRSSKSNLDAEEENRDSVGSISDESGMMTPKPLPFNTDRSAYEAVEIEESSIIASIEKKEPQDASETMDGFIPDQANGTGLAFISVEPLDTFIINETGSEKASPSPDVDRKDQRDWKRGQRPLNRTKSAGDVNSRRGVGVRKMARPGVKRVVSAREEMLGQARRRFWDGRNSRQQQGCYS